jgi:hypothetical protein
MFWTLSSGIFVSENNSWTNFTKACLRIPRTRSFNADNVQSRPGQGANVAAEMA